MREAIVDKFKPENNLDFTVDQVTVGCGAKQLLFNALMATLDEGDEVVIPTPCWVSYPEMVKLTGGIPVTVETRVDNRFIMSPDALRAALNENSKWLMLNSPSNPTGAVYSEKDLAALAEVLRDFPNVWILSDDIYEHLVFGDARFATLAAVAPDLASRTLTVNGVSKSYAMTGWRVGYAGGPLQLIKAMNTIQGQSTSHTCSISQYAAVEALTGDQSFIGEFRELFEKRRDRVVALINDIPGLSCDTPDGAFYVFVDCQDLLGKITPAGKTLVDDMDFAMYLMEEAGVAVVPGSGFLADGFIRISYAASEDEIESFINAWNGAIPIVIVPTAYPQMTEARAIALQKVKMLIYGNHAIRAAVTAMQKVFAQIIADGGIHNVNPDIVPVAEIFRLQKMDQVKANEKRFLR